MDEHPGADDGFLDDRPILRLPDGQSRREVRILLVAGFHLYLYESRICRAKDIHSRVIRVNVVCIDRVDSGLQQADDDHVLADGGQPLFLCIHSNAKIPYSPDSS